MDFIVFETEFVANNEATILVTLGQRFLPTSNALINCRNVMMKLSFKNIIVDLNILIYNDKLLVFIRVIILIGQICMFVLTQH